MSGMTKKLIMLIMAILLSTGSINIAHAVGGNSTGGQWEYSLAPLFLWAQGIQGDSRIGPTTTPLDIYLQGCAQIIWRPPLPSMAK